MKRKLSGCAFVCIGLFFSMPSLAEESILETVKGFLPDWAMSLISSLLAIAIGVVVIRVGKRAIRHMCHHYNERRPEKKKALSAGNETVGTMNGTSGRKTAETLIISVFSYIVYFLVVMVVLGNVGVDTSSVLTVAGIGGVALTLGSQTLVKDAISGLFLWVDGYVKVGDIITVNGTTGTVENVSLRTTTLRCTNGNLQMIPNGDIRTVTNLTRDYRCALVDITVAHGQDYRKALKILEETMIRFNKDCTLIEEPPVVAGIISSDGRCVTVRIESRCAVADCWKLEREIRLYAL